MRDHSPCVKLPPSSRKPGSNHLRSETEGSIDFHGFNYCLIAPGSSFQLEPSLEMASGGASTVSRRRILGLFTVQIFKLFLLLLV